VELRGREPDRPAKQVTIYKRKGADGGERQKKTWGNIPVTLELRRP